jgi:uncharacterized membrane protein
MTMTLESNAWRPIHPLHAILLAFPFPLFAGSLIADVAYWNTQHVQWLNFSQWLNAGALVGGGLAILWALVTLIRAPRGLRGRPAIYLVLLLVMWVVGFVSALVHARDAWATMPDGIFWAAGTAILALAASWVGFAGFPRATTNWGR